MKARRKEIGMSAEQVAEQLKISPSTVYRYENGDIGRMGIDKLAPIAAALGVSILYLLGAETPEDQQIFILDAQRTGKSLAEFEAEAVQEILDREATDRLISALEAADLAAIQAFAEVPDDDIYIHLHTMIDDDLTRDGRILALKRVYELSNMVGYGRFATSGRTRATPPPSKDKETTTPSDALTGAPGGK